MHTVMKEGATPRQTDETQWTDSNTNSEQDEDPDLPVC